MTIRMDGALRRCLRASTLGGLIAFAFVPAATAQWLPPHWRAPFPGAPPWRAAFPGDVERSLEAQGYVLTAPLIRRPGVYLADVSTGPAGYQRLVIDARSGLVLERFAARSRIWAPSVAAWGEEFGEPPPLGAAGSPLSSRFSSAPNPNPTPGPKSAYGGPANVHIPAAISPYDSGEAPGGTKPKRKSASAEHKVPATKAPTVNPPLPPPAPRETKPDGFGSPAAGSTEVENLPPAGAPAGPGSSAEASEKPKVSVVPPALFE